MANPRSPDLERARAFHFLMRFLNGESIRHIALDTHHHRDTVRRYMRSAASQLVESAQHSLLADTFPKMVQLLNAAIDQQLKAAEEGKPVDTALVERLLKGLYIVDAPQLRTTLIKEAGGAPEAEEQTLTGFIAKRVLRAPSPEKVLEGQVNGDENQDAV